LNCSATAEERQFSKCDPAAATRATTLPLDGTPNTGNLTSTSPCVFYKFTASVNVDLIFSFTASSSALQVALVNTATTDVVQTTDFTIPTSGTQFLSPGVARIPAFALFGQSWYVRVNDPFNDPSVSYALNVTQAATATPPTVVSGKSQITGVLSSSSPLIWQITLPDPNKASVVTVSNVMTSNYVQLHAALNKCPTSHDTYIGTGSTPSSIRTLAQGDKVYLFASTTYSNSSVSFNLDTTQVVCGPASGLQECSQFVNYNTPALNAESQTAEGFLTLFILLGGCNTEAVSVLCGAIYPKCDANGFGIPPCPTDCQVILAGCPNAKPSNMSSCVSPPGVTTYCYAKASGSMLTISLATIIALFWVVWM